MSEFENKCCKILGVMIIVLVVIISLQLIGCSCPIPPPPIELEYIDEIEMKNFAQIFISPTRSNGNTAWDFG